MAVGSIEDQQELSSDRERPLHRLPAQVKVMALVGFVCCVVATPAHLLWPYLGQVAVLAVVVAIAGLSPLRLMRGLAIELPFVAFALAMPFLATGPTTSVAGVAVSIAGLWGAATLLAKSTVSVFAALILASTTRPHEFVAGLQRLHLPGTLTEILGFMVRYLDVIRGQWRQMTIARASRGFRARDPRSWRSLSGAVGSGFIRAYERGERVHLAMLSRGYAGALPEAVQTAPPATARQWLAAAVVPTAALGITVVAWWSA
ncbi:MAG TPA: cobalt ECF transporter T component CbiQ [Propionicimonas sp.]|nr:cobalt ECF transporter T component CbiQ [Propionicimonas sp.]